MKTMGTITIAATWLAGAALAMGQSATAPQKPVLGPTVFRYDQMTATKNATGDVRSVVKQPTATVNELEIHITTLNPGQTSHPAHRHVNEELILIDSGECETLSDGKWVRVKKGDIIFNASNSLHQIRNVGTVPAQYHVINWSPNKQ